MTHPLTPPPEQLQFWKKQHYGCKKGFNELLTEVAQWGWDQREPEIQAAADAELEACCEWTTANFGEQVAQNLHLYRRPKPPSLKQEGFTALELLKQRTTDPNIIEPLSRALEALND